MPATKHDFLVRVRRTPGAAALHLFLGCVLPGPAWTDGGSPAAAEEGEAGIVGPDALIGQLVPVTGDTAETRTVALQVEFRFGSAELTERAIAQPQALGEALVSEALREAALGIYGHTDASGPAEVNQNLSERRAQAVALFLEGRFAIAWSRFRELRGYGENRLRRDLPPDADAQRRVEVAAFHAGRGQDAGGGSETEQEGGTGLRAIE